MLAPAQSGTAVLGGIFLDRRDTGATMFLLHRRDACTTRSLFHGRDDCDTRTFLHRRDACTTRWLRRGRDARATGFLAGLGILFADFKTLHVVAVDVEDFFEAAFFEAEGAADLAAEAAEDAGVLKVGKVAADGVGHVFVAAEVD